MLEQLPVVADVIAKSLGIARGELRRLAEQGRITALVVMEGRGEFDPDGERLRRAARG